MRDKAAPTFNGVRSAQRLHQDIEDASQGVTAAMTAHLRAHAERHGWAQEAVSSLHVDYKDGGYHPRYDDSSRDVVERLEYGDLVQRANPALRTWALHAHEHASALHDSALYDAISSELF